MGIDSKVAPDGVMDAAITTVMDQMAKLDSVTKKYQTELTQSLTDIKNIEVKPVAALQPLNIPQTPVPNLNFTAQPTFNAVNLTVPNTPEFKNIDSLLSELDLSDLDIPVAPEMPAIQLPETPGIQHIDVPLKPQIDTDIQLPEAPVLDLPELQELIQLDIPVFIFPELPDFNDKPPSLDSITVPNVFIDWKEPEYESELLSSLQAKVKLWMSEGGTGFPPAIEDALFNRARRREGREVERAVQEAIGDWSARNFSMPPGMLVKQVAAIREQGQLKASELNRDILIEASKLEIENIRFMVEQGIVLEQLTSNLYSNVVNRLFETAKFNAESQISVFNAQVALFNAQNSAFETLSSVYKTKLDGALAKLSAYKTVVDAQVAIGQINEQYVQVYKAKTEAVLSNVELYKALVQGASARADVIKNQFDAYRTEVQAYSEQISAEKVKVDAYEAQVRGETSKVGMFEAQSRAYASTVQAIQSKADVKSKAIQLKMEAAKTWISKYTADVDGYKAGLQASLNEVQMNTTAFGAQVEAWKAGASVDISHSEMQSRYADMNTRGNIAFAEMQIKQYEANIQHAIQEAQIALESAKALGQYSAQLAAGAMSAAHISASISGSGSANTSYSNSESESTSTSHNYNY